ncbi:Lrp/AsnC family transcriptional regulator, regulator for asnA, asnC and gidA [Desulfacinum hydrothermale DSM 13146]|uniref:Lrp/AsnC family transcriptional regulator, regulator for asnA, asnC and gidA n=1 Tax=Desulfacinum hydrothermale DSM 13146 TaxID=1121390 RepID=A0A1W1XV69_9BACT|nr:Lrp/AsnC family transcriptional regulator [Desulfacinum hydrothermale]SMC27880.1 Lrp/AsnC family transcriptional regulator, regulator for asnA, asnC and gidA [Desulfacinum hydrothermale DSM 13146]
MKIDETNLAIIKHLRQGRRSFRKIAEALGLTENTVRNRVQRLMDEKVLSITGVVDPGALPGHRLVIVGVKLHDMDMVGAAEAFKALRGVVAVTIVTGRYDLMVLVLLNQEFDLLQFYTEEVSKVSNVQSVETFVVYKTFNIKVPYVL